MSIKNLCHLRGIAEERPHRAKETHQYLFFIFNIGDVHIVYGTRMVQVISIDHVH